ncbi:MAG: two-component system response regulator [Desulfobacteraceae bacterium 4572_19]|nr:MAG: two-component system response regulator [Desulfobacteraceae bacterium 4572_19]
MKYKILIVDDSLPMRAVIKKTIRAAGYGNSDFFEAADGQEALEKLNDDWIDIVLSDYNMPKMNGLELVKNMNTNEATSTIPILIISTESSKKKPEEFLKAGATGFIKKPFTPETIRAELINILGEADYGDGDEESDDNFDF